MATNGILVKIEEALKAGISREELNKNYNKGTVTKVFNKIKDELPDTAEVDIVDVNTDKEVNETLQNIESKNISEDNIKYYLEKIFENIDENNEYEVKITISKKNKIEAEAILEISDPFKLYNSLGKVKLLDALKKRSKEDLINIIKKHFKFNKRTMNNAKIDVLAKYILSELEKTFSKE